MNKHHKIAIVVNTFTKIRTHSQPPYIWGYKPVKKHHAWKLKSIISKLAKVLIITIIAFTLSGLFLLGWLYFTTCSQTMVNRNDIPEYLDTIWPPPEARLPLKCYLRSIWINDNSTQTGITVNINTISIWHFEIPDSTKDYEPLQNRVTLTIDEKDIKLVNTEQRLVDIIYSFSEKNNTMPGGRYMFSASPFLWFGKHTARLTIMTISGELIKYEWSFTIY
jgi:hypothetical protein